MFSLRFVDNRKLMTHILCLDHDPNHPEYSKMYCGRDLKIKQPDGFAEIDQLFEFVGEAPENFCKTCWKNGAEYELACAKIRETSRRLQGTPVSQQFAQEEN